MASFHSLRRSGSSCLCQTGCMLQKDLEGCHYFQIQTQLGMAPSQCAAEGGVQALPRNAQSFFNHGLASTCVQDCHIGSVSYQGPFTRRGLIPQLTPPSAKFHNAVASLSADFGSKHNRKNRKINKFFKLLTINLGCT